MVVSVIKIYEKSMQTESLDIQVLIHGFKSNAFTLIWHHFYKSACASRNFETICAHIMNSKKLIIEQTQDAAKLV
jgi:hypothetical protein